ncbi:MAG: hypothetical protein JWQ90_3259 [Hydrocarboniphaga sp.]|uniref:GFA family protein n=1 Tax=Hydrocarboniphaga sp. TaxID=2033016 RepID=UPI00262C35F7|nr:GFA family protein [Hydrocarboniphaga sp.]MDB5970809.1 hypothetical protein [Hydrocarboniphaga sp.]
MGLYAGSYTGSCLCGGIQYRVDAELAPIQLCHCSQCRKAQGSAFASNSPVAKSSFQLIAGADLLKAYESSPGKRRFFCSRCGSPVYSARDATPELLRLRVGLINEPLPAGPEFHFHTASKANWLAIDDGLPQYAGEYPAAEKTPDA